jgi:hypothetical protein
MARSSLHTQDIAHGARNHTYALILACLAGAFALRVIGQAIQRWTPLAALPPFDSFQGSRIPYWALLSTQLVLIVIMTRVTSRVATGALPRSARAARVLGWAGGVYMAGSLVRIAIGVLIENAPAWFSAWISGVFHLVLAAFVLTLSAYHAGAHSSLERVRAC